MGKATPTTAVPLASSESREHYTRIFPNMNFGDGTIILD